MHGIRFAVGTLAGMALIGCGSEPPAEPGAQRVAEPAAEPVAQRVAEPGAQKVAAPAREAAASGARGPASCANRDPLRQALFGELHVHTAISMDAFMFQTRLRPDDAYRFAVGEEVLLPPLDAEGKPTRPVRIERPLDFAAVTDHAMNFGATHLCATPGSPAYDSEACVRFRSPIDLRSPGANLKSVIRQLGERIGSDLTSPDICGEDGVRCREASTTVWQETLEAAERWNDTSEDCTFTTFAAYEYTATPELTKVHRNVIFRNDVVPELPISYVDEPDAIEMWRKLRAACNDAGTGCDALAIPHNSNLSNGHMFAPDYGDAETLEEQREIAELRVAMEPVVEMMQMKGDSECRNGMWKVLGGNDELCAFEKMRPANTPDCEDGTGEGALAGDGCISRLDFARYALVEGLREADRLGVNPYAFGLVAATDGHDATPGAVEEWRQDLGLGRPNPGAGQSPGGLAGVWAEENSRDSIFDALRRRETFGTSGPRISVRFFGGWDFTDDLCSQPDLVAQGYAEGVPMGNELPPEVAERSPVFVVSALRDPGTPEHPGGLLQRVQIVKGWADDDGNFHQRIADVAGSAENGADVDPATCKPHGPGRDALCGVWRDPEFDPKQRAVYYARVVENPSCSQTGWSCALAPDDRTPPWCTDGYKDTVQERAWTSPIWYSPAT